MLPCADGRASPRACTTLGPRISWVRRTAPNGKRRLAGDTARAATTDEVKDLRQEARTLKEVVAEQALELRILKNVWPAPSASSFATWSDQSTPTYPVSRQCPGQDGDPRVLVLIKFTASSAIFCVRFPARRSTVRPSHFHHPQTSYSRPRRVSASGRSLGLRHARTLRLEPLPAAQHRADDPRQLGRQCHHHGVHVRACS